ncbi:Inner membrane ABC transporter permease protein YdcV [bacterium HR28]|jgi:spermidine/putrescine transport system permease protein|uniref:ABC transporter permease n=1 Tax=Thermomicrobium roseum TaxID=500 RepID=A0A7C1FUE8_THERO|nr:Inner membrane ABC transporter permease protein YdcV [bacterium HR28]
MTSEATMPSALVLPKRRWRVSFGWLALYLNVVLAFVFLYAPIVVMSIFSFNASRQMQVWMGFTLDWYVRMLHDERVRIAAQNSLIVALVSTLVSTVIGTLAAMALERTRFRVKRLYEGAMYLPIIVPEIVMAIALLVFFNLAFTWLDRLFGLQLNFGLGTITIAHIAFSFPFVAVVVRARLADFDRTLEQAAQDLGATDWQTFRYITLPLLMPGIIAGALLAFTLSIDDFVITFFNAGVGSTTLPLEIYGRVRRGITPDVNALSTVMLLASIVLVLGSLLLQRRRTA